MCLRDRLLQHLLPSLSKWRQNLKIDEIRQVHAAVNNSNMDWPQGFFLWLHFLWFVCYSFLDLAKITASLCKKYDFNMTYFDCVINRFNSGVIVVLLLA